MAHSNADGSMIFNFVLMRSNDEINEREKYTQPSIISLESVTEVTVEHREEITFEETTVS